DFNTAVRDELVGKSPGSVAYLGFGRYFEQLDLFCRYFSRSSVLVMVFDDLKIQPVETFASVCRHIGVDDREQPEIVGQRLNTTHDLHWVALWRFMARWRGRAGRRFAPARYIDSLNTYPYSPPPMDAETRELLVNYFSAPNAKLSRWLDRDLGHWSD